MPPMIPDAGTDSASHFSIDHPKASSVTLRNPLPLSASQEAQVRDLYHKRVRSRCAEEIKQFAACARGRTVTATWTCRQQRFAMNSCMILHASKQEEDAAREEWFAGIQERRKKRDEDLQAVEKRRTEVIDLTKQQEEKEKAEEQRRKILQQQDQNTDTKKGWWR